jgi:hypothetical protein
MYNPQNNNPNAGIPPELQSMIMNYSGQPSVADPQQQLYIQAMLLQQQQQQQQQQQSGSTSPYDSPQIQRAKSGAADSYGSASSSPSLHNLPQRFGSPLANQQPMTSPQQAKAQKDEQARRQSANTPRQRSVSVPNSNDSSMANDTALSVKRVSAILALNQELIRACMELSQDPNTQPNEMLLYQARLQSNLTYLATMADISVVKPGEQQPNKTPVSPSLSPLPPARTQTMQNVLSLAQAAQSLFEGVNTPEASAKDPARSPLNQMQMAQQQQRQRRCRCWRPHRLQPRWR